MEANLHLAGVPIGMMQLDIILPSQQFGPRRKQAPEQRLMMAVLQDALDCVEKYRFADDPRGRRLFDEAKQWLLAAEPDWPYSFECICAVLDLDVDAVRQRLRVAPERQAGPRATPDGQCRTGIQQPVGLGSPQRPNGERAIEMTLAAGPRNR